MQALEQRRVTEARWRLAVGEAWAGSGLVLTPRLGDPFDPRRVAMAIFRHSQIAVTMDIYSQVSSASTRETLKRLGSQLGEGSA